ncbi:tripartite tricarboxylate transporter substrate binding protein [Piscinibacter sp. HJYY11]|uniref:Bug family tripartite tricarboxylate transporter substrate binding protein n=1 Tax=Piscinibacter sp. HJYY11 TaxID=2801333 RepID=UPI00191CC221|nr:tripartite tricarboxylate transporter substrate binding protein [Piscinibacter sp. HJYY11]MBL0730672.1 tripartite tricarboxylate transporter substrate binding protein [Piscinibacter sp. HJYY11]
MLDRLLHRVLAATFAVGVAVVPIGAAAAYPERPLKLIVPYTPGGSTDVLGRALAEHLRKELGQTVVVENKPGANTGLGAQALISSPADGHTLLLATAATVVLNPLLQTKLAYDPTQLVPVARVAITPLIVVAQPNGELRTLRDVIAKAKAQPGRVNYASTGIGSSLHLAGELLQSETGTEMTHIPYKGSAPALTGLLGGETQIFIDSVASSMPLVKGGKLVALAVTSRERLPVFPDVPTVAESGVAGFDVSTWFGILVPKGTPPEAITRLNAAIASATRDKAFRETFEALGLIIPEPLKPADFSALITKDIAKWTPLIKAKKITLD